MSKKKNGGRGNADAACEFSLISSETLLALYRNLLKCRDGAGPKRRRARVHAADFDAVAVGATMDLRSEDHVRSTERTASIEILHGAHAGARDAEVSSILLGAVGAALANKTRKNRRVALVFGGNGDESAWEDALEVARVHSLPMVFAGVIDLERERRNHAPDNAGEPGTELPRITVDGNDVVAVYRVAHEAIDRARRDRGPTLIECAQYRVRGRLHDDAVANMEAYLTAKGLFEPVAMRAGAKARMKNAG